MRADPDCAISLSDVTFENPQGSDHILEILVHLKRLAARAGDRALAQDLESLRARASRRKRIRMN